ncbi:MAG TPA: IS256 family transposase, partial [Pseudomonas sp.]|nr:IS256 family transposase [Pseudomonas sp.]
MSKTQHPIADELLDQLLANYQKPEDLIGADGILKKLTKKPVERALDAELTHHLGHGISQSTDNTRNGFSRKKLKGEFGELPIEVPRDRHGTFDPQIVEKHQTRWTGFEDKILLLYARGMTVRAPPPPLRALHDG